jgi:DNA-binding NtrC family response regulator
MGAIDKKKILMCWVGGTDIRSSQGDEKAGYGPIAQAVRERQFDEIVLLSNYAKRDTAGYIKWLEGHTDSAITLHLVDLSGPTDLGEIYQAVVARITHLLSQQPDAKLTFHLSPGTPAMAAIWIIVSKTRFGAELIESSTQHGVKTARVPFDISAEFIPELMKRPDADVSRLSAAEVSESPAFEEIVHRSPVMRRVIAKAQKVAPRNVSVLIEGESGTGKELMARAIHKASLRAERPFIAVNCGAISSDLVEAEFFGHTKGTFTGATENRKGHIRSAEGGTLFLDEIGELPLDMQVKLLRVLQERKVVPVGESAPIDVDFRVIAATNRSLADEVSASRFREDLFFRLAVAVIRIPPLRERSGDLTLLIDALMKKINAESAAEPAWEEKKLSPGAKNILQQHQWRGNVRELMNTLTRATIWSEGTSIGKQDIKDALFEVPLLSDADDAVLNRPLDESFNIQSVMSEVARHYLTRAVNEAGDNKTKAAEMLGLGSYQTVKNWINKHGLEE